MPRTISLLRNMEEKTHEKSGEVSQEKTASSASQVEGALLVSRKLQASTQLTVPLYRMLWEASVLPNALLAGVPRGEA
jgi:hypothetical protein